MALSHALVGRGRLGYSPLKSRRRMITARETAAGDMRCDRDMRARGAGNRPGCRATRLGQAGRGPARGQDRAQHTHMHHGA